MNELPRAYREVYEYPRRRNWAAVIAVALAVLIVAIFVIAWTA